MATLPRPVLVVDFGAQYAQLIARRVREAHLYSEVVPHTLTAEQILAKRPLAIILSGGPSSVYVDDAPAFDEAILHAEVPVFGICYGFQVMAAALGGQVDQTGLREYGRTVVRTTESVLFAGQPAEQSVWMSHGDAVVRAPDGCDVVATTAATPVAAFVHQSRPLAGVQFHPEVAHTDYGQAILQRFLYDVAGLTANWSTEGVIDAEVSAVSQQIGAGRAICGLSGGVDSAVAAALVQRAIGDRLTCVFVDHGLLRQGEVEQVERDFVAATGARLVVVDARKRFLDALARVTDPEQKRKIIGSTFIDVFDEEAGRLTGVRWLAQGTIYPDVIESAGAKTGKAQVIKSHHNVGGLPQDMAFELVEPLRELFKDEVRQVGLELGLPYDMVYRHPFPGPGLGVRILGAVKKTYADLLRRADAIFIEELRKEGWYEKTSQAFAVFLPVKSVGVVGDGRRYEYVIALRAVETVDFMTARWAHLPYELLERASNRIINEIPGVSRVTYDISSKPPATIEWE